MFSWPPNELDLLLLAAFYEGVLAYETLFD